MNLRIGLDFDNTLACYDKVFAEAAKGQKLISNSWTGSKKELKDFILTKEDGDTLWQKIQGKVYGKYMKDAFLFPGVAEFLWKCKLNNAEVFVVSHKTEYGHFDEEKINLRQAALEWMRIQGFFSPKEFNIQETNVYFAPTRQDKVKKINELGLSFFVDDLIEVFQEKDFSSKIQKVLFSNSIINEPYIENLLILNSWKQISSFILPELNAESIFAIINQKWGELNFLKIHIVKASGNSRVYKVEAKDKSYILKIYPDLLLDSRERLKTEYNSCSQLSELNLPVPDPIRKDENLNWGLYSWIDGQEVNVNNRDGLIFQLIEFIDNLKKLQSKFIENKFTFASEACISGKELEFQIQRRLSLLKVIDDYALSRFLREDLEPYFNILLTKAKATYSEYYNRNLESQFRTLSPSDFGFHNAKVNKNGKLYIFDLEYFGWDDPVKLISDFLWHPGMNLTEEEKKTWFDHSIEIFKQDEGIKKRFNTYYPLYGIRWCLILLNEFLKIKLENRLNADPEKKEKLLSIQGIQLEKSKSLLEKIKSIA